MAGNQVLEWFDIDSEIKTANLKDVRASFGTHDSDWQLKFGYLLFRIHWHHLICMFPRSVSILQLTVD